MPTTTSLPTNAVAPKGHRIHSLLATFNVDVDTEIVLVRVTHEFAADYSDVFCVREVNTDGSFDGVVTTGPDTWAIFDTAAEAMRFGLDRAGWLHAVTA